MIVETEPTYICHCDFRKPKNAVDYAFIFRYRRRRWLEVAGLLQGNTDSEDDPGFSVEELRSRKTSPFTKNDGTSRSRAISIVSDGSDEDEWQTPKEAIVRKKVKVRRLALSASEHSLNMTLHSC